MKDHKILILGNDGYIGYALTIKLLKENFKVFGADDYSRRERVSKIGSDSLTPILDVFERIKYLKSFPNFIDQVDLSLGNDSFHYINSVLASFEPDTIVHLAEQPSAPWSMKDVYNSVETQTRNTIGTLQLLWAIRKNCPKAHLIKLGSMGEYGTPNCPIPEGTIPEKCLKNHNITCPMQGLLFPRIPGSFYHLSKVHDTYNIEFACRNWKLRSTDIMQGIVIGLNNVDSIEEITRFDYDQCFGTVVNRFCAQVLSNHPLTIYGRGNQTRGFLTLKDSLNCITLAIKNPPKEGEYRTFNQYAIIHNINDLAFLVKKCTLELGLKTSFEINYLKNPRKELEEHYYNTSNNNLKSLGYKATTYLEPEITSILKTLSHYKDRIKKEVINPTIKW